MRKLKIGALLLCMLVLSSCGDVEEEKQEKKDFFVNTMTGSEFSGSIMLKKTGQVRSSQDIVLTANASGRITNILLKRGDAVTTGQVIAYIEDTIGSYGINVARAANSIQRSEISYDSTKLQLDSAIFNAELSVEKLEKNLQALKENSQRNITLAQDILDNSAYEGLDSRSSLELQQLDNSIEKSKLDYEISLRVDEEALLNHRANLRKNFNVAAIFFDDVIEMSDSVLGVTVKNKIARKKYDDYLGLRDANQKRISRNTLEEFIDYRNQDDFSRYELLAQEDAMTDDELQQIMDFIDTGYQRSRLVLSNLQETLNNSVASVGSLGQGEIDTFLGKTDIQQSSLEGKHGVFISFSSGVKTFLKSYKERQESTLKSIEIQKKGRDIKLKGLLSGELNAQLGYDITKTNSQDSIQTLQSQLYIAKNTLKNAIKNKDIGLRSLKNSINESNISYSSAIKENSKLTIRSPINGTISENFIDVGQEVFQGTKLFSIVSDATPEIEISLSAEEKKLIQIHQKVFILNGEETIEGSIYAVSEVADKNLNYKITITFESGTNIIGNLVEVEIPVSTGKMLVPINIVHTQGDDIGILTTLSGTTFVNVRVRLGDMFEDQVEIVSCAKDCDSLKIIMNDVSNFDENKFIIIEK